MTHPPTGGEGGGSDGGSTGPGRFRIPGTRTPFSVQLIDCGRAWGTALVAIARLLTGRPA